MSNLKMALYINMIDRSTVLKLSSSAYTAPIMMKNGLHVHFTIYYLIEIQSCSLLHYGGNSLQLGILKCVYR